MNKTNSGVKDGAAGAAIFAAGAGIFTLGVSTTLKASSEVIKKILSFYVPTGPLSGQTTVAVVVWLLVWAILHQLWKNREINFRKIFAITMILIILGFLGGFPPLFEAFFEEYE